MKEGKLILVIGVVFAVLTLGIIATINSASIQDIFTEWSDEIKSVTGFASKKDSDGTSGNPAPSGGTTGKSERGVERSQSDGGETTPGTSLSPDSSGSTSTQSTSGSGSGSSGSSRVVKTEQVQTFLDDQGNRVEIEIRTETRERDGTTYQKIKVRDVEASSTVELEKETEHKVRAKLSNGEDSELKIMPNTASRIALSKLKSEDISLELREIGSRENLRVVYVSQGNKETKFLGLFKVDYNLVAMVDGESGEIVSIDKPWWLFLANEPAEEPSNQTLGIVKPLEQVTLQMNEELTIDLEDYFINADSYSVSDAENLTLELTDSLLTLSPNADWMGTSSFLLTASDEEESLDTLVNVMVANESVSIQTIQYGAIVGQKVKWKKELKTNSRGKVTVDLPELSENVTLTELNENGDIINTEEVSKETIDINPKEEASIYEIEYYTPAPIMYEEEKSQRVKEITVQGHEETHYTDVLSFYYLENEAKDEEIRLYHVLKNSKKEVKITKHDLDENGLIDYIEWVIPHLSNQTYELIIEITAAEHLDENRIFIEDVYDKVSALDGDWTGDIPNEHYIRVKFESELTSERDISIYARSESQSTIEIYLKDSNEKIAEITGISEERMYKTYLTNLAGSSAEFDLKIISSSGIEFDYIVDPATLLVTYPENRTYNSIVTQLNYTITNAQECRYSLNGGLTNTSVTCGNNVTGLTSNQGSNTWAVYANSSDTSAWDASSSVTFSVDTVYPTLSITYPLNTSYNVNVSALNYTVSEANCARAWYSIDSGVTNSTSAACGANFTNVQSNEGSNTWRVYVNDTAGNTNSTSVTFLKDTSAPQISFTSNTEANGANLSQSNIDAEVDVTESNEDSITFLLYDSTGLVNLTTYTTEVRSINWTGLADGVYTYNVSVNDTSGNTNTTETRTITLDNAAPTISLSCSESSINAGDDLACSCSASDALDASPVVSYESNPDTSSTGRYTTTCSAVDDAGNSASSSVTYRVESEGSGTPVYAVPANGLANGYDINILENWRLNFQIENSLHLLTVNDIAAERIELTIAPTPQTISLSVGEERKLELTDDNYYDLAVRLNSIEGNRASINLRSVHEEMQGSDQAGVPVEPETGKSNYGKVIALIIILALAIVLFFKFRRNNKRHRRL